MKTAIAVVLLSAGVGAVAIGQTIAANTENPVQGERLIVTQAVGRVVICHVPPGNPANRQTIEVDAAAVNSHLAHGDSVGACGSGGGGCNPITGVGCGPT